jgi:hypothetical protein
VCIEMIPTVQPWRGREGDDDDGGEVRPEKLRRRIDRKRKMSDRIELEKNGVRSSLRR